MYCWSNFRYCSLISTVTGALQLFGQLQFVVDRLPGARRNLMVVERRENVLWVPPIDAVAVFIEHEHVHEVRPRIDFVVLLASSAPLRPITRFPEVTVTSSQTSFESAVPCVNK